ncbi:MAG: hypothetical protein ACTHU0_19600 [Kofleriaceae bacterium]
MASILVMGLATPGIAAAQVVRDHRAGAQLTISGPTQPPPTPPKETWKPRRGQVWVAGQYEWRNGKWTWKPGHYEARKKNKRWQEGKWDRQGDRYVWVPGGWIDAPREPDPPPRIFDEVEQRRPGFVWVKGYWEWSDGSYEWVPGKLQAKKKGKRWTDGRWDNVGGRWQWTAGAWVDAPREIEQPPPPRSEKPQFRRGFVWVPGYWKWDDGSFEWVPGKLESKKRGKRWQAGRWESSGGRWQWIAGAWTDAPREPDAGPPAPPDENPGRPRPGYVWVKGHFEWRDGDYEWVAGKWERERAQKRWIDARWENAGGKWVFTAGTWQ